jgi:antitoxin component of MazEF toxin-antitoxin module
MKNLSNNMTDTTWSTTIEDAGDGSGDGILTLPPELCEMKGWKEGTVLNLEVSDGILIITEVDDEKQQSLDK